ncbi:MAG TPA: hypothetical protein DGG94_12730 [Micromonosporaceae bacterium]|nr:hypothetical protein [Micromonosporaceae bacterium]HCU50644.1 hypothetical protein [Micromonosporaceae bacterium]
MAVDLYQAAAFMAANARLLDRRRLQLLIGEANHGPVLEALEGYRNPDGGYGWGLEPDLRSPESQPGGALHAFEVFEEIGPATSPHAVQLCDWLATVSLSDGGVPFSFALTDDAGCAPFWTHADHSISSLHITAAVAAAAHRVATNDSAVAQHEWLTKATEYCLTKVRELDDSPHPIALAFVIGFLDAAHDTHREAATLLRNLSQYIPASGRLRVEGGLENEMMRPLDFAPTPGRPARAFFSAQAISAELHWLTTQQQADGGWVVDFASYSPAAALEWRGYMTVRALSILQRNIGI